MVYVYACVCTCVCAHVCSCLCMLCTLETIVSDVNQLTYYWLNVECILTTDVSITSGVQCIISDKTLLCGFLFSDHFEAH